MNFLAGRLAATESAYFLQESKHAVGRLSEKKKLSAPSKTTSMPTKTNEEEGQGDVLHEILRHSIPIKGFHYQPTSLPSISTASKWQASPSSSSSRSPSHNAHNPLREVLCLPQVTFGPRRSGFLSPCFFLSQITSFVDRIIESWDGFVVGNWNE